ncbi:uncharacterized protein LOC129748196 [Uranotaenia lowii]|uniref:uncharacterized protein LOC129748196 n=1 Tax=Uranotaenia lowii TaxID=190385 RepID=UPI00247921DB|nr:uncharacterized protein LOC129748196 [Uranotaenia lowii]
MKTMLKSFVLLLTIAMVASQSIQALIDGCKEKVPMSEEQEKSYLELKFDPEDRTAHCLMHCVGEMLQLNDEKTGMVNVESLKNFLKAAEGSKESCEELKEEDLKCLEEAQQKKHSGEEDDECSMAFRVYQCFEEEFHQLMMAHMGHE